MSNSKVLVIDDDATLRRVLTRELTDLGFEVSDAPDARAIGARVAADRPDVVLLDLRMPEVDGHRALATIRDVDPGLPVVVLTGHGSVTDAVRAMQAGAYDFLQKPTTVASGRRTPGCERCRRPSVSVPTHRSCSTPATAVGRTAMASVDADDRAEREHRQQSQPGHASLAHADTPRRARHHTCGRRSSRPGT